MPTSLRLRHAIAAAILGQIAFRFVWDNWTSSVSNVTAELGCAFFIALTIGLACRSQVARWLAVGVTLHDLYTGARILRHMPQFWGGGTGQAFVLGLATLALLGPWARRDWSLRNAGLMCLGVAWFPLMFWLHGFRFLVPVGPPLAAGVALLLVDAVRSTPWGAPVCSHR
jgi:hypothetical protein